MLLKEIVDWYGKQQMKMHLLVKLPLFHRCCVIVSLTLFILFSLVLAKLYLGYKTTTWWIAEMRSRSITTFLKLICFSPNKRYFNDEKQHEEGKQLNTYFGVLKCFIAFLHTTMFFIPWKNVQNLQKSFKSNWTI